MSRTPGAPRSWSARRREAHGSYLKRNPHFSKGQLFPQLIVEFFLKTKDKNWKGKSLICDDPLLIYQKEASQIQLFNLANDVSETTDVAGQNPAIVERMSRIMREQHTASKLFPFKALD